MYRELAGKYPCIINTAAGITSPVAVKDHMSFIMSQILIGKLTFYLIDHNRPGGHPYRGSSKLAEKILACPLSLEILFRKGISCGGHTVYRFDGLHQRAHFFLFVKLFLPAYLIPDKTLYLFFHP